MAKEKAKNWWDDDVASPTAAANPSNWWDDDVSDAKQVVNPMVAQGQAAQQEWRNAGQPEVPADASIRPADPLKPRSGEEWRLVDRSAGMQAPPAKPQVGPPVKAGPVRDTYQEYRDSRPDWVNQTSDFLLGKFREGDQAIAGGLNAAVDLVDKDRNVSKAISTQGEREFAVESVSFPLRPK